MKAFLTLCLLLGIQQVSFGQDVYTSRKGSKFFPLHYDIAVTADSTNVRYEVYNHWYSRTYSQLRQVTISSDSLKSFDKYNDSLSIRVFADKVKIRDKKLKLKKTIRHKNLCASLDYMRKISFAADLALAHSKGPHALYHYEDLQLSEVEFREKVLDNLNKEKE